MKTISLNRIGNKNKTSSTNFQLNKHTNLVKKFIHLLSFLIYILIFSISQTSCSSSSKKDVISTNEYFYNSIENFEATKVTQITKTQEPSPMVTNTTTNDSPNEKYVDSTLVNNFNNLPDGQYILYSKNNSGTFVISPDGLQNRKISDTLIGIPLTYNGHILQKWGYLGISDTTFSLDDGVITTYPHEGVISPSQKYLANINYSPYQAFTLSIYNISTDNLCTFNLSIPTNDNSSELIELPTNIKWLSNDEGILFLRMTIPNYTGGDFPSWKSLPTNGLYIVDTKLFITNDNCDDLSENLILKSNYEFNYNSTINISPDNRYIIVNTGKSFIIFDLLKRTHWQITKKYDMNSPYIFHSFAISPNNKWIAYTSNLNDILLQSIDNSNELFSIKGDFSNIGIYGWIISP